MTDKQIIIKRIRDCDNCKFRPETSKVCYDYENCYMVSEYIVNIREQLRTKTQECEELQNKFIELNGKAYSNSLELDQIKAENEKLKKHNEALLKWNGKLTTTFEFNNQEIKQAEQKLERIRDFMLYEFSGKNEWVKKQILQIIDEVE